MLVHVGRLRRRSEFLRVAAKGRKLPKKGLILQARACGPSDWHADTRADLWLGITVSRKVGNAVERNRARRRLRMATSEILPSIAAINHDYVVIGRRATLTRRYSDLLSDVKMALHRLGAVRDDDGFSSKFSGKCP